MKEYKNINIHPLSSSTKEGQYLLSYNGQYFEANIAVVELVEELKQSLTEEEAIASYLKKKEYRYTSEQVRSIVDRFISPLFCTTKSKRTFLYEKELFSTAIVDKFSDAFRFVFAKIYMFIILVLAVVLDLYFFFNTKDLLLFNSSVNIYIVVGLFAFMLISSFLHELGHASACKYFGVRHGGIGFGLYLTFPVLYTDVTDVWQLNRTQRCLVNIAGIYFQSYILIALLLIFLVTGNDIVRYLILTINFGFIMTLNPFFKFDGYWIASDLLGVPNLRARSMELTNYCYKRVCKQRITKIPYLLQIRPIEKYGLLIYSAIMTIFMSFYFIYIIPSFIYRFIKTFPDAVSELILYLSNGITPPFALLRNIGAQVIFLLLIGYLFWSLIRPFVKKYANR